MCSNCGGNCAGTCTDQICTGDVSCSTAQFQSFSVPSGQGLNYILSKLEELMLSATTDVQNVSFTVGAEGDCVGLTPGTYTFQQLIAAIIDTICTINAGTITTEDIVVAPSFEPDCIGGTTFTEIMNSLFNAVCILLDGVVQVNAPINSTTPSVSTTLDSIKEVMRGVADNPSYLSKHTMPSVSPTSFTTTLQPMNGLVNYWPVNLPDTQTITVNATKDTYYILNDSGTWTVTELANGSPIPSVTSSQLMVYKFVSNSSGITGVTTYFPSSAINPTALDIPDDYIQTKMIADGQVVNSKLDNVGTAGTFGHSSVFTLTTNAKGRVTSVTSNLSVSGPSNGQVLKYNAANSRFENANNLSVATSGFIPKSTGSDYGDSSLSENVSQVVSTKKVEVNISGGSNVNATSAAVTANGGAFLAVPMSATSASALTATDGMIVYVNTTNGTFTSVGFWGREAGAWVKL